MRSRGELQRLDRGRVGVAHRPASISAVDTAMPQRVEIGAVEVPRVVDQRRVALGAHARDDVAHRGVDVRRHLALGRQEGGEARLEIGVGLVQA